MKMKRNESINAVGNRTGTPPQHSTPRAGALRQVFGLSMLGALLSAMCFTCATQSLSAGDQGQTVVPAKLTVIRVNADQYVFAVTPRKDHDNLCAFVHPISVQTVNSEGAPDFPTIGTVGTALVDGSLLVDRGDALELFSREDARFVNISTECGGNSGDFSPKALFNLIAPLQVGEDVSIPALLFFPFFGG